MKIEKAIFDLLNRTYVNNAAGPDKIDSKLIKFCAKGFARPLSSLYNKIFNRERFQISGNLLMSFLFLKKGDKSSVINLRPISLLLVCQ